MMNSYIKNTNEDEFSDIKSLHVTYYACRDLQQGL